jgi:hypothetical protein
MTTTKLGLVFKIQLGVFGIVPPSQQFLAMLNQFKDVSVIKDKAGLKHYMVGAYPDLKSSTDAKEQMKKAGIKDVCVMAFYNGYYISNEEALKLLSR